jgi:hypothetical protein
VKLRQSAAAARRLLHEQLGLAKAALDAEREEEARRRRVSEEALQMERRHFGLARSFVLGTGQELARRRAARAEEALKRRGGGAAVLTATPEQLEEILTREASKAGRGPMTRAQRAKLLRKLQAHARRKIDVTRAAIVIQTHVRRTILSRVEGSVAEAAVAYRKRLEERVAQAREAAAARLRAFVASTDLVALTAQRRRQRDDKEAKKESERHARRKAEYRHARSARSTPACF